MAALAPMPRARVSTAAKVNPALRRSERAANLRSFSRPLSIGVELTSRLRRKSRISSLQRLNRRLKSALRSCCHVTSCAMALAYVSKVVDLLDPALNRLHNMTVDEARQRVLS